MEIPVELSRIIINESVDQQIIVLSERDGDRSFPIVIGMPEILALDRRLKRIELPRPMTHDLLAALIDQGEVHPGPNPMRQFHGDRYQRHQEDRLDPKTFRRQSSHDSRTRNWPDRR